MSTAEWQNIAGFKKIFKGRGIIMEVTRPLLLGQFYLVKWPVNPNILAASIHNKMIGIQ